MIASRLLKRIETNWEKIAAQVIQDRNDNPHLQHYRSLSDHEIRERAEELATRLATWLTERDETLHSTHFENLGRRRFEEGMPLHEVVLKLNIIKRAIRRYATEQNYSLTAVEIYDELELLRAMAGFFDFVIFRVTKGYEDAMREVHQAKASSAARAGTGPILMHL
ncbi:MAG: hypothetical protein NW208_07455 [Bryobacter sp.]|nr:hypothetical protein [Bryobacter sp.]